MRIFINHLGYEAGGRKRAVLELSDSNAQPCVSVVERETGRTVFSGTARFEGSVDGWKDWTFFTFDFSPVGTEGRYFLRAASGELTTDTEPFSIGTDLHLKTVLSDMLYYFTANRCGGKFDRQDRAVPFYGSDRKPVDVHGGWYDASGDVSKYLSHLSYATYMNPQQTPLVVWALADAFETLSSDGSSEAAELKARFLEEIAHGADFLVRMQDHEGYFYTTVFDRWSKQLSERMICSYGTQKGIRSDAYRAAWRQGGGVAIAALARASRLQTEGEYPCERYLEAAKTGFAHLETYGTSYTNDGRENILDDYCALLAASELFAASDSVPYLRAAEKRARSLCGRLWSDSNHRNWWRADTDGDIPFFHAVEAGFPVVSLLRFLELSSAKIDPGSTLGAVRASLEAELSLTCSTVNPFGYARQYVKPLSGDRQASFFIPDDNWSGYWWQGENARIASLAAAARKASRVFGVDADFTARLEAYASDQVNWILGMNPYDVCMLTGHGRNNAEYERNYRNCPGGIINGVTSGFDGNGGIDFLPEPVGNDPMHRWRWSEQWIPHAAWFILALASVKRR